MNDKQFVEQVRDHPEMYGLGSTYHPTAALLLGFNQARSGGLLRGFHEWLAVREGELSSQHWMVRVLAQALPGFKFRGFDSLRFEPEQERQAVDHLFSLILEFLEVRDDPWALTSTYAQYHHMRISLYGGDPAEMS
ncbi:MULTISPECIES: hypothetical protein [Streptomyces]|uniref:hypothetical protein n=1 Tax=Streptomyces TaxID=1883 RepID=UPI00081D35B1|nr:MULTISPECIES: hypothetical protein [Streptomyces]KAA6200744.1 hypothetical protein F2B00_18530 [Streptomyces parvus]PVC79480.1 hypothetical protein DBP20_29170 [Streptomyces sp. CS131]GGS30843.1 hypothetical protein GCM10010221_31210 [Streptomyces parvus]SCF74776.1 hypothetical protein GA0115280_110043 [Streptomyces sp. Cmuel-A718b]